MSIFLDRIDAVPLSSEDFSFQYSSWVSIFVDTLNENLGDIETAFNLLTAPNYSAVQINDMFTDGTIVNGMILYDTDNNVYVGMQNGALVKFTTGAYP